MKYLTIALYILGELVMLSIVFYFVYMRTTHGYMNDITLGYLSYFFTISLVIKSGALLFSVLNVWRNR